MSKHILILQCNPNTKSFVAQAAKTYEQAARSAGYKVRYVDVATLKFDHNNLPNHELEPAIIEQQKNISWADHIIVASPVWWMSYPACYKAYLDRVFSPGFAYKYPHPNRSLARYLPEPLLKGKTLRLISTQDGPWWSFWLAGHPFAIADRFFVYNYMGLKYRRSPITSVRKKSDAQRKKWLSKIERLAVRGK